MEPALLLLSVLAFPELMFANQEKFQDDLQQTSAVQHARDLRIFVLRTISSTVGLMFQNVLLAKDLYLLLVNAAQHARFLSQLAIQHVKLDNYVL